FLAADRIWWGCAVEKVFSICRDQTDKTVAGQRCSTHKLDHPLLRIRVAPSLHVFSDIWRNSIQSRSVSDTTGSLSVRGPMMTDDGSSNWRYQNVAAKASASRKSGCRGGQSPGQARSSA